MFQLSKGVVFGQKMKKLQKEDLQLQLRVSDLSFTKVTQDIQVRDTEVQVQQDIKLKSHHTNSHK
jgi:hypothetical protein